MKTIFFLLISTKNVLAEMWNVTEQVGIRRYYLLCNHEQVDFNTEIDSESKENKHHQCLLYNWKQDNHICEGIEIVDLLSVGIINATII